MGRVDGKVAFITGAARAQGRSHAVRLAEEGADIIAIDLCENAQTVEYELSTKEDLDDTVIAVEKLGRRIIADRADVRDQGALQAVVDRGIAEFGHLDIVAASAGIFNNGPFTEVTDDQWSEMIDINLNGVYNTLKVTVPQLISQGSGGSVILTSSVGGVVGWPNMVPYVTAKHGVIGLMHSLANELGPHRIRVNAIAPTAVNTPMIQNPFSWRSMGVDNRDAYADVYRTLHPFPEPWIEARDVSNALLWLSSDEARFVTGITLPVDLGALAR
jgi:(+)-trans-carveol dehydrogenase